jgi:hypothetical protein
VLRNDGAGDGQHGGGSITGERISLIAKPRWVLERTVPNFTKMEEVLRSSDLSERSHLTGAKGLREFESLTVNRTHGLAEGKIGSQEVRASAHELTRPYIGDWWRMGEPDLGKPTPR